jgi:hypothetical protein
MTLTNGNHYVRYIRKDWIDDNGSIGSMAFQLRRDRGETAYSGDHWEHPFDNIDKKTRYQAILEVLLKRGFIGINNNCYLAKLDCVKTKQHIWDNRAINISFEKESQINSHIRLCGTAQLDLITEKNIAKSIVESINELEPISKYTSMLCLKPVAAMYDKLKKWDYDNNTTYTRPDVLFKTNKTGVCFDYVNYLYMQFKLIYTGIQCYLIVYSNNAGVICYTHTFIVFPYNILVEASFKPCVGIYLFKNLVSLFKYIKTVTKPDSSDLKYSGILRYTPHNRHMLLNEFIENIVKLDDWVDTKI